MAARTFCLVISLMLAAAAADAQPATEMAPEILRPNLLPVADGRRLNIHCIGKGSPTVVFEQGGEGMVFNWARVQPAITAVTRTCFYDRGGFGWSDPPHYPVTARSVTDDLHALLPRAGVQGPIVLVGHSIGGFYATMYADRFPEQVAGLVLVEPGFAGQSSGLTGVRADTDQANIRRGEGYLLLCAELARRRLLTAANLDQNRCYPVPLDAPGPEGRAYALHAVTGEGWYEAEHSQSVNYFSADDEFSVSHAEERAAARRFGDMPLVVLSREQAMDGGWRTPQEEQVVLDRWRAGHRALAARSTRGRFEIVPGAGHFIQKDRPEAVIAAIREVVTEARAGRR
jgi:pimeloyl-ACP methyl ester carboxylesterase